MAGTSVCLAAGLIDPGLAAPVMLGVTLRAFIGTRVLVRLSNRAVRRFFQMILAVLGIEMIVRGIRGVGWRNVREPTRAIKRRWRTRPVSIRKLSSATFCWPVSW
ncbi:MAG: hypothetical protein ACHQ9S_02280 [Candidatus Binatia bacterium]